MKKNNKKKKRKKKNEIIKREKYIQKFLKMSEYIL